MIGSEKQIAWAEKNKEKALSSLNSLKNSSPPGWVHKAVHSRWKELVLELEQQYLSNEDAKWWIEKAQTTKSGIEGYLAGKIQNDPKALEMLNAPRKR